VVASLLAGSTACLVEAVRLRLLDGFRDGFRPVLVPVRLVVVDAALATGLLTGRRLGDSWRSVASLELDVKVVAEEVVVPGLRRDRERAREEDMVRWRVTIVWTESRR
jgi:hypothetical protein